MNVSGGGAVSVQRLVPPRQSMGGHVSAAMMATVAQLTPMSHQYALCSPHIYINTTTSRNVF